MASSKAHDCHDCLQVVDDVISASLTDNAVKSLGSASATGDTYTESQWTDACEDLLRTYRGQIHPNVCPASTGDLDRADVLTTANRSEVVRIKPSVQKILERGIVLPTDYHIIIPLVPQGLPTWAECRSTKERQKVPWRKGSVVCIKGGTNLICTQEGGAIYIVDRRGEQEATLNRSSGSPSTEFWRERYWCDALCSVRLVVNSTQSLDLKPECSP